jgi:hypothetical protein
MTKEGYFNILNEAMLRTSKGESFSNCNHCRKTRKYLQLPFNDYKYKTVLKTYLYQNLFIVTLKQKYIHSLFIAIK